MQESVKKWATGVFADVQFVSEALVPFVLCVCVSMGGGGFFTTLK